MKDTTIFRGRFGHIAVVGLGLLVLLGFFRSATDETPRSGPADSTFGTGGSGTGALAALLERNDYEVTRRRVPLAQRAPDPSEVIVIIGDVGLEPDDEEVLFWHVHDGGRAVVIGSGNAHGLSRTPPGGRTATGQEATSLVPLGGFDAIQTATPRIVWEESGSLLPVVGNDSGALVGVEVIGAGRLVAISDSSIVSNRNLDRQDHALLALLAVGPSDGPITFLEYVHGFGQPTGLAALPSRWKQALLVLALAGLVWLVAKGVRFGPAEDSSRPMPPPRAAFVDAVALSLQASGDLQADSSLTAAIDTELSRRGVVDRRSPDGRIEAAVAAGADRAVAETALTGEPGHQTAKAKADLISQLINKEQL